MKGVVVNECLLEEAEGGHHGGLESVRHDPMGLNKVNHNLLNEDEE